MKLLPIAEQLSKAIDRTVFIDVSHASHRNGLNKTGHLYIGFRVSIQPGLDGSTCSGEDFTDVGVMIARCDEIAKKYAKKYAKEAA